MLQISTALTGFILSGFNLLLQKFDLPYSTSSKSPGQIKIILTSSQFTEHVQNQGLNQIHEGIYRFLLSFFFLHNFKTEIIIY